MSMLSRKRILTSCFSHKTVMWTSSCENVPSVMRAQRRIRSARASAQSDQRLCWARQEELDSSAIRLAPSEDSRSDCADAQSDHESWLGTYARKYIFPVWAHLISKTLFGLIVLFMCGWNHNWSRACEKARAIDRYNLTASTSMQTGYILAIKALQDI